MSQVEQSEILWREGDNVFAWLGAGDAEVEKGIASNQYVVLDGASAMLLDPGGYHVFERVLDNLVELMPIEAMTELNLFLSHQDPDVCASLVSWLEIRPSARVVVSKLWERFLLHFAVPVIPQLLLVPDEGAELPLPSGAAMRFIPAHYLHSPGNFSAYDTRSRILFSGDIGAAVYPPGRSRLFVEDFEEHTGHMFGFHQRYMSSNKALRRWVERVRPLDIHMICPQHGPILRGADVGRFLDWLLRIDVGVDRW
jgi:flavorubredoxin